MKLYVMRHGYAGPHAADEDPSLTDEGTSNAAIAARYMVTRGIVPGHVVASPSARAMDTARVLCGCLCAAGGCCCGADSDCGHSDGGCPDCSPSSDDRLGDHGPAIQAIREMIDDDSVKRPLVVGHHDNLRPALEELTGDDVPPFAMTELRLYKVARDGSDAHEAWCRTPSEMGDGSDRYESGSPE